MRISDWSSDVCSSDLLIASGSFTGSPLVMFAYGVRRVALSTIGVMQYVGPMLQLLTGVFLYREGFSQVQLIGFGLIWLAIVLYAGEGLWRGRRTRIAARRRPLPAQ